MENDEAENVLLPQVDDALIPKIGQEFESHEEAYKFYNRYARNIGFSVRKNNNRNIEGTKEVYWKEFCCYKEGETDESWQKKYKDLEPRYCTRKRGKTRVGCQALLQVAKQKTGDGWVVVNFDEKHNHVLTTPSRVHLLRSHRKVSKAKKALMQQLTEANIPTCQQLRLMEIDSGGPEAIGCTERDLRNYEKDLRKELAGNDADTLIDQFLAEKEINPDFFFDYETDDDGKLVRCFWADSQCQRSYASFGEVVVFDTTYNTNKYSMIFAPFVGVNNHGQTTIFACGLLSDETTDSFVWLFPKFLVAMPNEVPPPGVIITDQDAAISKAISVVFPSAMHRYCLWHILNKFSERINATIFNEEYHKLKNIIKHSENVEQFEKSWTEVMENSELDCNDWLSSMYEIRARWVPAYVNCFFSAGMSSSQRSESGHSFMKKYVNKKHTLVRFVAAFNRALRHQRHEELIANHADLNEIPRIATMHSIEEQAMKVYTKYAFLEFQKEFQQSFLYCCQKLSSCESFKMYSVDRYDGGSSTSIGSKRTIKHHLSEDKLECNCGMFDFYGWPCRHILAFMIKKKQLMMLPEKYILKRWTKKAMSRSIYIVGESRVKTTGRSMMVWKSILCQKTSMLIDDAILSEERSAYLDQEIDKLLRIINDLEIGPSTVKDNLRGKRTSSTSIVHEPNIVKAKGSGKRLKRAKEIAISKQRRQCKVCGGVGHNRRTCPQLKNLQSQVSDTDTDDEVDEVELDTDTL